MSRPWCPILAALAGGALLAGACARILTAVPATAATAPAGWREDFTAPAPAETLPPGWELQAKVGTPVANFAVRPAADGTDGVLTMVADRASASVIACPGNLDLRATPILRWRWRVLALPPGGDGRQPATDDQAIGIYAGTGGLLHKQSVSYRWDTATPKGESGNCTYGAGTIRIRWFTLRNQDDGVGQWRVEERNLAEDFQAAWGWLPETIYLSICCNSQYTGGKAAAELDWIELRPAPPTPAP